MGSNATRDGSDSAFILEEVFQNRSRSAGKARRTKMLKLDLRTERTREAFKSREECREVDVHFVQFFEEAQSRRCRNYDLV